MGNGSVRLGRVYHHGNHSDLLDIWMKEISDDLFDQLLAEPVRDIRSKVLPLVCDCGTKLNNGYCLNPECEWDAPEEVFDCEWCGCCPDPEHCVWSVTCPICQAIPKQHCKQGTKIIGLHAERWEYGKNRTASS